MEVAEKVIVKDIDTKADKDVVKDVAPQVQETIVIDEKVIEAAPEDTQVSLY